jgi:transcriptional regulator with XRE-family HTH domain
LYTIGSTLKERREQLGIHLEDIENSTKISKRYLRAIESGNWDKLPDMVYTRGFIRSYARELHINVDSLLYELQDIPFEELCPPLPLSSSELNGHSHPITRVAQTIGRGSKLVRFVFGLRTGRG